MAEQGKVTDSGKSLFKISNLGVAPCQNTLDVWVNLILLSIHIDIHTHTATVFLTLLPQADFPSMLSGCFPLQMRVQARQHAEIHGG